TITITITITITDKVIHVSSCFPQGRHLYFILYYYILQKGSREVGVFYYSQLPSVQILRNKAYYNLIRN
ncbi:hypothetical protein, partial [Sphingobacterium sp. JUb78]|uniref:hypothetical protein n=1 Tax=Sphingobacterium sp. JUb78 TaxID=2485111 RepID=UPI001A9ED449